MKWYYSSSSGDDESSCLIKGLENMKKTFTIKQTAFEFSDKDITKAATALTSGTRDRARFYTKVNGSLYSVRQLLVEMIKQKGISMPDSTTHEAIRVLRALRFEITEV